MVWSSGLWCGSKGTDLDRPVPITYMSLRSTIGNYKGPFSSAPVKNKPAKATNPYLQSTWVPELLMFCKRYLVVQVTCWEGEHYASRTLHSLCSVHWLVGFRLDLEFGGAKEPDRETDRECALDFAHPLPACCLLCLLETLVPTAAWNLEQTIADFNKYYLQLCYPSRLYYHSI